MNTRLATTPSSARTARRRVVFTLGDRLALAAGIVLTVFLLSFFSWRMYRNVSRDRALVAVPVTLPAPPPQ